MGKVPGLGEPARDRFPRRAPHPTLHRAPGKERDQFGAGDAGGKESRRHRLLEADLAPGPAAMSRAMKEAIACARDVHIGWCAARNITHAGAIGYFALQAAEAGMAGIVMTASGPMMAYHGARVAGVSTNPIAIAFPAAKGRRS